MTQPAIPSPLVTWDDFLRIQALLQDHTDTIVHPILLADNDIAFELWSCTMVQQQEAAVSAVITVRFIHEYPTMTEFLYTSTSTPGDILALVLRAILYWLKDCTER
jgi:hypothetical protein